MALWTSPMIWKLIPLLAVVAYWYSPAPRITHEIKGSLSPQFEDIRQLFRKILDTESQGVSLTVLHKGNVAVNLYGGYADKDTNMLWNEKTMAVAYSSTKVFAGLICAVLASRGDLDYDKRVVEYWPEFGQNGKENLTVRDILDHKAGLVKFAREFTLQEAFHANIISRLIEESEPLWSPGTLMGYHALTYGFLVDQIVRRVDAKKRSIKQFYDEEILAHLDDDFYLGLPKSEAYRVARIYNPSLFESIVAHGKRPIRFYEIISTFIKYDGMADITANYPKFLSVMLTDSIPYNNYEIQQLPLISNLGIGTSKGFARAVRQFWKAALINSELWHSLAIPEDTVFEICIAKHNAHGHGFFYTSIPGVANEWSVLFNGNGQQFVEFSKKDDLVIVMLRNGLKPGEDGVDDYEKLRKVIYKIIKS